MSQLRKFSILHKIALPLNISKERALALISLALGQVIIPSGTTLYRLINPPLHSVILRNPPLCRFTCPLTGKYGATLSVLPWLTLAKLLASGRPMVILEFTLTIPIICYTGRYSLIEMFPEHYIDGERMPQYEKLHPAENINHYEPDSYPDNIPEHTPPSIYQDKTGGELFIANSNDLSKIRFKNSYSILPEDYAPLHSLVCKKNDPRLYKLLYTHKNKLKTSII
jgi:hypothetical protein